MFPNSNSLNFSAPAGGYLGNDVGAGASYSDVQKFRPNGGNMGGLGFNLDTANLALGGLQSLGNLWQAWEANKLAKEQFKFQKGFSQTNLANSIQSYNTTLEDRTRSRAFTEGQSPEQAQMYIDKNRLPASRL
jgi:hypothetical protein